MSTTRRAPAGFILLAMLVALTALTAAFAFRLYPSMRSSSPAMAEERAPSSVERAQVRRLLRECVKSVPDIVVGKVAQDGGRSFTSPMGEGGRHRCAIRIRDDVEAPEGQAPKQAFVDVEATLLGGRSIGSMGGGAGSSRTPGQPLVIARAATEVVVIVVEEGGRAKAEVLRALPFSD